MMRKRWTGLLLVFILLWGASMACSAAGESLDPSPTPPPRLLATDPPVDTPLPEASAHLSNVTITPDSGVGPFIITVSYYPGEVPAGIMCSYPNENGDMVSKTIGQTSVAAGGRQADPVSIKFSIAIRRPGAYTAGCAISVEQIESVSTGFNVTGPGSQVTPTPVPPGKTPTTVRVTIQPRQVKGAGEKVSYSGVYVCSAQASVTLTIKADGSAELYAAGLGFADYLSCRSSGSLEGWYLNGLADPVNQTVTFSSCNKGSFSAVGVIQYSGNVLSGSAACLYTRGSSTGKPAVQITLP